MLPLYLCLVLAILVSARVSGVTYDPTTANGHIFDYIVVGGGLSGVTVASRLSEDPSKTVLLIEAGNDDRRDPRIYDLYNYGQAFDTSLDWAWRTDGDRTIRGGKTLGGSSSINQARWCRGAREQYDAISHFLSEEDAKLNWNFDSLFSYMKKSETFHPPDKDQQAKGADYVPDYHGFSGPVQAAFPQRMYGGPQQSAFVDATRNVTGVELCPDDAGGDANCIAYHAFSINPRKNDTRSSSAEAYLTPVEHVRTNWLTLVNHTVTRVLLDGEAPKVTATGVQFKNSNNTGETFTAKAHLDVILSAGTIRTPQLLQVSGIGDPSILDPLNVQVKLNIPTVGRNFQEKVQNRVYHSLQSSFNPGGSGPADILPFLSVKELFSANSGSNGSVTVDEVKDHVMAMYPTWAESQSVNALNADALTTIFSIQAELMVNDNVPVIESYMEFNFTETESFYIITFLVSPFSRGNVTITSSDVFEQPQVTVNWLDVEFDLALQTAALRADRKVLNHPAFTNISAGEIAPGIEIVPDDGNGGADEAWQAYMRDTFDAAYHEIGTAAMMRRDLGGVVDGTLRVYDTTNLRVVDNSIMPLEVSAHPSSSLYGVAEKAADIIKSGV